MCTGGLWHTWEGWGVMFPIRDENPTKITPVVNRALILVNIFVFGLEFLFGDRFIMQWAFIPERLHGFLNGSNDIQALATVFSAMFMHAGIAHIFGNMLFLWIFGDNVEEAYGHGGYLLFYLLCGVGATAAQYLAAPLSGIPNLGASGAIGGVLGAYVLLHPLAIVRFFIWPFSIFIGTIPIPAWIMLGLWFALQFWSGLQSVGQVADQGGVAYWAHVGGFVVGLLLTLVLVKPFARRRAGYLDARR